MATTTALPMDGDESILDPAAEAEWQILRRQIELAAGFWLGFIFSPSPRPVAVLRRRVEQIYRLHASRVRLVRPSAPEELREILPRLLEPESVGAGCIWVEAVHLDASTFTDEEPGPWATAWDWTLMRTNEHREVLRHRMNGGLVYAVPPQWKPRARIAAPDLWSIRSLVLDLPASAGGLPDADRRDVMELARRHSRCAICPSVFTDSELSGASPAKSLLQPQSLKNPSPSPAAGSKRLARRRRRYVTCPSVSTSSKMSGASPGTSPPPPPRSRNPLPSSGRLRNATGEA